MTLFGDLITAHCMFCEHVERDFNPQGVHDVMERHYAAEHRADLDALLAPHKIGIAS